MEANQEYSLDPGQVRLFAMVVLAMAAEVLEKTRFAAAGLRAHVASRLPEPALRRFLQRRRCSLSFLTDVTTVVLAYHVVRIHADGPTMLYNVIVTHFILNSPELFAEYGGPFSLDRPLRGTSLPSSFRIPPALLQGARGFVLNYSGGRGEMIHGIRGFVNDLAQGGKVTYLWRRLRASTDKLETLRQACLWNGRALPPMLAYVVCRFLSLWSADFLPWDHNFLGQYAAEGLYLLRGCTAAQAKELSLQSASFRSLREGPLFVQLAALLPDLLAELDEWAIVPKLVALGLSPFVLVNLEHYLCEYRKIMAEGGGTYYSRESVQVLLERGPGSYRFPVAFYHMLQLLSSRRVRLATLPPPPADGESAPRTAAATSAAAAAKRAITHDVEHPRCPGCKGSPKTVIKKDKTRTKRRWQCKLCNFKWRTARAANDCD